jgi:D-alanine-D-alanine ligase
MSARSVLEALDRSQYEIIEIGITHEGEWRIGENVLDAMEGKADNLLPAALIPDPTRPGVYHIRSTSQYGETLESVTGLDVIFPVLHGTFGEDGTLQGLLEMQNAAYVGAGVLGSAVGMDKGVFHAVMAANGIPVVETRVFLRSEIHQDLDGVLEKAEQLVKSAPYPLFVKPANLGSSVGVSKCQIEVIWLKGFLRLLSMTGVFWYSVDSMLARSKSACWVMINLKPPFRVKLFQTGSFTPTKPNTSMINRSCSSRPQYRPNKPSIYRI